MLSFAAIGQPVFVEEMIYRHPQAETMGPKGRVAELIRSLSEESPGLRRNAAEALLDMGPAIEPALQWALQHGENQGRPLSWDLRHVSDGNKWVQDPRNLRSWHAEHELDVLISHLKELRASSGSIMTLHHTNVWLTNVLCDLGRQSETDVAVGNFYFPLDWARTNRVSLNIDRASFWDAMRALQQCAGLAPVHPTGQNRLVFHRGTSVLSSNLAGSVVSGSMQLVPMLVKRVQLPGDVAGQGAGVELMLAAFAEPKFTRTGPHAMVRITECIDDLGRRLTVEFESNINSPTSYTTWMWEVPVRLGGLGPGRQIKLLKGEFSVGIGPGDRYMTITNLMLSAGRSREFDGLKIQVKKVTHSGSQFQVDVELSAPRNSPFTRSFSPDTELEAWIWDEATQTIISRKEFHGTRHEAGLSVGTWSLVTPQDGPEPATLVWKTPTETRWHTVPFELRDIPVL